MQTRSNVFEPLLNRKEAAKYLGVSPKTLAVWDCTKRYDLKPIKVGRRSVRYRKADLDAFLDSCLVIKSNNSKTHYRNKSIKQPTLSEGVFA